MVKATSLPPRKRGQIFDVTRPNHSQPSATSRPIVNGSTLHQPDPMVKAESDELPLAEAVPIANKPVAVEPTADPVKLPEDSATPEPAVLIKNPESVLAHNPAVVIVMPSSPASKHRRFILVVAALFIILLALAALDLWQNSGVFKLSI